MRRYFASIAQVVFLVTCVVALVEFIGFGKRGGWQFALDLGILAIGAMTIRDWSKKRRRS